MYPVTLLSTIDFWTLKNCSFCASVTLEADDHGGVHARTRKPKKVFRKAKANNESFVLGKVHLWMNTFLLANSPVFISSREKDVGLTLSIVRTAPRAEQHKGSSSENLQAAHAHSATWSNHCRQKRQSCILTNCSLCTTELYDLIDNHFMNQGIPQHSLSRFSSDSTLITILLESNSEVVIQRQTIYNQRVRDCCKLIRFAR